MAPKENNLAFEFHNRWAELAHYPLVDENGFLTDDQQWWLEHRDRELEDFLGSTGPIIIDFGDILFVGKSRRFTVLKASSLLTVHGSLEVTASTDTVATVLKNGVVTGHTLTIPAGNSTAEINPGVGFGKGDYWQMQVTTAGSNGAGLVVEGQFS